MHGLCGLPRKNPGAPNWSYAACRWHLHPKSRLRSIGFIASFDRKLVLSDYTLDTLMLNNVLRMILDENYPIEYADMELWCHEYIDNYL